MSSENETKAVPTLGEQIATLKELLAKASFTNEASPELVSTIWRKGVFACANDGLIDAKAAMAAKFSGQLEHDAALIVAMKNTLPALIARVEEVEGALRAMEEAALYQCAARKKASVGKMADEKYVAALRISAALKGPAA